MKIQRKIKKLFIASVLSLSIVGFEPALSFCSAVQPVTVEAASVKLNKTSATLIRGKKLQLKVSGTNSKVQWSSSNRKIAVVNSKGLVTAKAKGTATITAKIGSKKYTCKIKVNNPTSSKVPSCVASQTVYAVAPSGGPGASMTKRSILDIPESYIFIRNLDANAKITNIKSSNSKFRAEKREGMNAIGVSATDFERDYVGLSSTISFRVTQKGRSYNLRCKINVKEKKSPIASFKVGSKEIAGYYSSSYHAQSSKFKGKNKISIKLAPGYVLDTIEVYSSANGVFKEQRIKNGATVNLKSGDCINVLFHTTKKPANYKVPQKWFGQVPSPLHATCTLMIP